ncbi:MAG: hypothetical protein N5P05_003901 [Chroococcopsis gigantea SAG 12.99]|jgi:hypothetical protein|nr:PEP-CTERM sorting domain-containing protein [Chlorogloea purpurea SAG 13.99]MDV3002295.1 hypothetical protein [Chroococcopsis gigantea SAG 12.99]
MKTKRNLHFVTGVLATTLMTSVSVSNANAASVSSTPMVNACTQTGSVVTPSGITYTILCSQTTAFGPDNIGTGVEDPNNINNIQVRNFAQALADVGLVSTPTQPISLNTAEATYTPTFRYDSVLFTNGSPQNRQLTATVAASYEVDSLIGEGSLGLTPIGSLSQDSNGPVPAQNVQFVQVDKELTGSTSTVGIVGAGLAALSGVTPLNNVDFGVFRTFTQGSLTGETNSNTGFTPSTFSKLDYTIEYTVFQERGTPVPEPSAMVGLGVISLGMLGGLRKKR